MRNGDDNNFPLLIISLNAIIDLVHAPSITLRENLI